MPGTFTVRLRGTLVNEEHTETFGESTQRLLSQEQVGMHAAVVTVGTGQEDMPVGDILPGSGGYLYMKNLDTGNFVNYGPNWSDNMITLGRLLPSGEAFFKMGDESGSNPILRWQADTAPCKVQMKYFHK